jgi:hypothetical protein
MRWIVKAILPGIVITERSYKAASKRRNAVALFSVLPLVGNYRDAGDLAAHPFHPSLGRKYTS